MSDEKKKAPATTEAELRELRAKQRKDRERRRKITRRIEKRAKKIADLVTRKRLIGRLKKASVLRPEDVLREADHAARAADVPVREFRAMCLVILEKETGLPQRAIFGADHGPTGDEPPYCNHAVTRARGKKFLKKLREDPWKYMNGVHWTQTTWYEKVFRVAEISPDLTDPVAHMRVCFGDLAILRRAYGVAEAFRRYNGSGPAAEAYKADAMSRLPRMKKLVS